VVWTGFLKKPTAGCRLIPPEDGRRLGHPVAVTKPTRDERDAALAAVLAQAVRDGRIQATDALRVIKHEMRRRNTNGTALLKHRSSGAQAVIDEYEARGLAVPKNGLNDALHADHVYEFGEIDLHRTSTVEAWTTLLDRVRAVVAVTARENYELERLERSGIRGPSKYAAAGVTWAGEPPSFTVEP